VLIRHETTADAEGVRRVNLAAFPGPGEAGLVDELRPAAWLSLVAEEGDTVIGHLLVTPAGLPDGSWAAALGPMAVDPPRQRRSVGTLLVEAALEALRGQGRGAVVVLGHPAFYPRFGFEPAEPLLFRDRSYAPAFFALELEAGAVAGQAGPVQYLPAFDDV
jgi:putative acetyltransferase